MIATEGRTRAHQLKLEFPGAHALADPPRPAGGVRRGRRRRERPGCRAVLATPERPALHATVRPAVEWLASGWFGEAVRAVAIVGVIVAGLMV